MGGIANWFTLRSPEERKAHEEAYLQRMFPFGQEQKEKEETFLASHVGNAVNASEKLYLLLTARQIFEIKESSLQTRQLKKWALSFPTAM